MQSLVCPLSMNSWVCPQSILYDVLNSKLVECIF